jgi:hypothetical protein
LESKPNATYQGIKDLIYLVLVLSKWVMMEYWAFFFWVALGLSLYLLPGGIVAKTWGCLATWIVLVTINCVIMVRRDEAPIDD